VSLVLALLVVGAFAGIVERTRVVGHVRVAMQRARGTWAIVSDPALADDEKEWRLREESFPLLVLLGRIALGSVLALGLPLGVLWALDRFGWISMAEVLEILMRLDFLVAVSSLGILTVWWGRRRGR
jgi:hypothetical protein